MKRIVSKIFVAMMMCGMMIIPLLNVQAVDAKAGTLGENISWTLDCEGVLRISGEGEIDGTFPEDFKMDVQKVIVEEGVTFIEHYLFSGFESLESIELPKTLEKIGTNAFAKCSSLAKIAIPNQVKEIDVATFSQCKSLKYVELSNGLEHIDNSAFYECAALEEIVFPDTLKFIGDSAFRECESLISIILPDSIEEIGIFAFKECTGVVDVKLSKNLKKIGSLAFSDCTSLVNLEIPEGVELKGNNNVFDGCESLVKVALPESVTRIPSMTFMDCISLTEIIIPDTVTEIGRGAFRGCSKLKRVVIPQGVKEIGDNLFKECTSLEAVEIPESVERIGYEAFGGCKELKGIVIPDKVTEIDSYAFYRCENLKELEIYRRNCVIKGDAKTIPGYITIKSCGGSRVEEYAKKYGNTFVSMHEYGEWEIIDSTYEEDGKMSRICARCKDVEEQVIPKKICEHIYKQTFVKRASLAETGRVDYKCDECGREKSEVISKVKSAKLAVTAYVYDGKVKKPAVVIKDAAGNKISSEYYDVKYASGRKNVGKYTVTLIFKNRYKGTVVRTFTIKPKATAIRSISWGNGKMTVHWKKVQNQVSGYEIRYAANEKFNNYKTKRVAAKYTNTTIKNLNKNKNYYVKVRTYKTVKGVRIYSAWSKVMDTK